MKALLFPGRAATRSLLAGMILSLQAQPVINEFLAANDSIHPDNCDFDDYSDWIELFNPDNTAFSLADHFLTDDLSDPFRWRFPATATIPARGYLMIRADGADAGPGEIRLRGYWPWDSTFETRRFHASFRLSAEGEAIGLYRPDLPSPDRTLVPVGAVWKYRDTGTDPGPDWMDPDHDDLGWARGAAQLGYGEGDEATVVSFGPNADQRHPATHFRHLFQVADPTRLGDFRLRVIVDDGAVLYLNGTEFARLRMPAGLITHTTYANRQPEVENAWESVVLPRSLLRAGENLLAAEVHQASAGSSDLSWAAELVAAEVIGVPVLIDSVTFGAQTPDVSFGRNATNGWSFFGIPTPEGPNVTEPLDRPARAPTVNASLESGLYTGARMLVLSASAPVDAIRYTLDGSVPGPASPEFRRPLLISTNTVLRARAFVSGWIPGPVLTRSIFVDEPADRTLPVLSLAADPETLFGSQIGIYSNSTPYALKGREIPARVEFFEPDRAAGFAVGCGVRIGGEIIWQYAQKPLNLHLRGRYGDDVIGYQVFPGEAVGAFGRLNLRNGGSNWARDMLRDALVPSLLRGQAANDLSSYRPCVVFVNGRYWGIHNIRKPFDPVFFANEHHLVEGTYDVVQYARNEKGVITLMADAGSLDRYEAFRAFYTTRDLSHATNYTALQEMMNVDSFIDFLVATDFGVNISWGHNREFWSAHAPGSKWHWNVPDFDRAFDWPTVQGSLIGPFRRGYPLFEALTANTNFVNRLLQRYAAHLAGTFQSNRVATLLDTLAAEVNSEIPRHIARWAPLGGMPSPASRQAELDEIKQFVAARPGPALTRLPFELGINPGLAMLAVALDPPDGGNVRVAGVPLLPEYGTTVRLFKNLPVELTAEPAPGYAFLGWSNGETRPTIELILARDQVVTARFGAGAETVLPATLAADLTLTAAGSPYSVARDLVIPPHVTLAIGPGVRLLLPPGASVCVQGALQVNGDPAAPVEFLARGRSPWGSLSFVNATGPSVISNLAIRGASLSRRDPVNLKAAVSGYNSTLTLDGVDIEAWFPIFTRFGSTTLRNSRIDIRFTGDGINIKAGDGVVESCTFTGSPTPDTDAIDFDSVTNGIIRGNRIHGFPGLNSDAIDVGEGCQNLLVTGNRIFHVRDKGVSVGQASLVRIERNLIVDCGMGVGVKDLGSIALISQNTFAHNRVGVAAYEKNPGHGGGRASVTGSIFYHSETAPVTADALSTLTTRYSLSDTVTLAGPGNLLADPLFQDPDAYDFSLQPDSPALDAGDPSHPPDPDGSRADIGAYYAYHPDDHPPPVTHAVVINEVMAASPAGAPDWIELHNTGARSVDLGGWYLSDNPETPMKYRIADGTILPGGGCLVFDEDRHFGAQSTDSGAAIPFAFSQHGEAAVLFRPGDGTRPDEVTGEEFGASASGVSFGRYRPPGVRTHHFVAMAVPTPGTSNSLPRVGPVVISEIMYHPPVGEAEYLELVNITDVPVTLFNPDTGTPWKVTRGLTCVFPSAPPLTLAAGERILLVRNAVLFAQHHPPPPGVRVFPWVAGALDNLGETIEISMPGGISNEGVRQYIRVDRVTYSNTAPWPTGPAGGGTALVRVDERAFGDQVSNWAEAAASPGQNAYQQWASGYSLPADLGAPDPDPDGDGLSNALEYALGTHPLRPSTIDWNLDLLPDGVRVVYTLPGWRPDVVYVIQQATDAAWPRWVNLQTSLTRLPGPAFVLDAWNHTPETVSFYRLAIILLNPP